MSLKSSIDKGILERKVVSLSAYVEVQANLISHLRKQTQSALSLVPDEQKIILNEMKSMIAKFENLETDFDFMKIHFEEINFHFHQNINRLSKDTLTYKDLRLATFIKMHLSNKEIAFLLNLTHNGIKKAIQRLRKKLGLNGKENLRKVIYTIKS